VAYKNGDRYEIKQAHGMATPRPNGGGASFGAKAPELHLLDHQ